MWQTNTAVHIAFTEALWQTNTAVHIAFTEALWHTNTAVHIAFTEAMWHTNTAVHTSFTQDVSVAGLGGANDAGYSMWRLTLSRITVFCGVTSCARV
jgi:hypothetical protein